MPRSTPIDDALDGIREALRQLLREVADEIEVCPRYELHEDLNGDPVMEPDSRGQYLDRTEVLDSIRRLAQ